MWQKDMKFCPTKKSLLFLSHFDLTTPIKNVVNSVAPKITGHETQPMQPSISVTKSPLPNNSTTAEKFNPIVNKLSKLETNIQNIPIPKA